MPASAEIFSIRSFLSKDFVLHLLGQWFSSFFPPSNQISLSARLRSSLGALVGIAITGLITHLIVGRSSDFPLLAAPMGASAVLLFGVPASPLAQPWSLLGGNLISAIVGVSCAAWIASPVAAAALAVALSIGLMFTLRCVHPPSGAVALTAVLGGPAIQALGYRFVLMPIGLNSLILLAFAILYHKLTRHQYPHRAAQSAASGTGRALFTRSDVEAVLKARNDVLDIDVGDLESVLGEVEARIYRRHMNRLECGNVMTREVRTVAPDAPVASAWAVLQRHKIKALPVLDEERRVVGIITPMDFIQHKALPAFTGGPDARRVHDIMTTPVKTVRASRQIADLVPLFASYGHHHLPVVDAQRKLLGMITQADLVAGLHRQALAEAQVA
jgi:CBS domain-containing membrane protein